MLFSYQRPIFIRKVMGLQPNLTGAKHTMTNSCTRPAIRSFTLSHFDPLALYQQLCPDGPGFLETLNPLPKTGRYSVLPLRWQEHYHFSNGQLYCSHQGRTTELGRDPFVQLNRIFERRARSGSFKSPFIGGFFGYLGYDMAGQIEELPRSAERDLDVPELEFFWIDVSAVYDHEQKTLTLSSLDPGVDLSRYEEAIKNCADETAAQPFCITKPFEPIFTAEEFMQRVQKGKDYIAAGDIYQVNLSCRFDGCIEGSSTGLYQRLRKANPSPFACLLSFPGLEIISSSPERLVSLRDGIAETRPIAGTRPRGFNFAEDRQLGDELLCHPKERAEHIMLVDLERNDLGKVCKAGTVAVDELMVLERYSHVTHIVSNVRGELNQDCGPSTCSKRPFPAAPLPVSRKNAAWKSSTNLNRSVVAATLAAAAISAPAAPPTSTF